MVLPFHLPDLLIEFGSSVVTQLTLSKLQFMSWMKCNTIYPDAQRYFNAEFSTSFFLDKKIHDWRLRGMTFTRGFVIAKCPYGFCEIYYLHEILHIIRGPCSYVDFMAVNDFVYHIFKDTYMAFVFDDNH